MNKQGREFDVIVWGATGFTGRLVAEYLLERYAEDKALTWAMAGRSENKLQSVADELGATDIPFVIADSHDRASLDKMVSRAKVICTTVGPYAKYGTELLAACAEAGTHYVDLAGEPQWMRAMSDAYSETARASGARIVHPCGFDSLPSDIGTYYLQQQANERFGEPFAEIKLLLKAASGSASGGTVASLLNAVEEARKDRDVARILVHPYSLNPPGERQGPDPRDQNGWVYNDDIKAWTAPFVMAGINTKVVRRSNAQLNYAYGKDFRYSEATLTGKGIAGWMKASSMSIGLGGFMMAAAVKPLRSAMQSLFLPDPGEGPDEAERTAGFFNFMAVCKRQNGDVLLGKITGDRDPGYGSTSKMLAESALCLARDEINCEGGIWSPAAAMGAPLLKRLSENAGLSFSLTGGR